ncbi:fat-like cadherin-related tumor suppressor homolog isoform X2 [Adelges cooleyi]|uniref:fat-like cadherin-related tumor suppressor homolog isoform X2 n=1 Tax=Adelges cooleyi TaxID=133065 RepID=UPI00217F6B95|nr:fat-like cadherin-related tumor suppressor homolog isoform X2 [Adelges cooleyi]
METGYKTLLINPLALIFVFLISSCCCSLRNGSLADLRFTRDLYNATIPENAIVKTYVRTEEKMGIYCSDEDVVVRYKLASQQKVKFFKAEEKKVGNFWFLLIRTKTDYEFLNRERQDKHNLEVKATITTSADKSKDKKRNNFSLELHTNVVVTVLDLNDLSPIFYPDVYEQNIPEDTPLHSSVLKVSAEDADIGVNGEVYYSFKKRTDQFAIHPRSGIVTITRPLKFEERRSYDFIVEAEDRGVKRLSRPSTATVKFHILQANLFSPEIYVQHLSHVVEESNCDIYAIIKVTDRDSGLHGVIRSLEIVDGDPDGHFRIRETGRNGEYNIVVLNMLDRETAPKGYNLSLRAVDSGTPERDTYESIHIELADINDNAPVFERELYEVNIAETAPINSPVIKLKVTDKDEGKNAQVFLEIVGGNEGGEFRMNKRTGMLYTAVTLDAEHKSSYTLTVSAIDQGNVGSRKQSAAKVKIFVVDANDNDPLFEKYQMEVTINENETAGTFVTKIGARDKDSGENGYISYSIANLKPVPFDIDHFTGIIKTTQLLDYETMRREYVLHIRASDWGYPYRRQTEMKLVIKVKDVNDNRPQFEKIDCKIQLPRFTAIGKDIMTMSAVDFDDGDIINYRVESGNEDNCFAIDTASGILSVTCDLTDVRSEERVLKVTATDGFHYSDLTSLHISLVNTKKTQATDDSINTECRETGVVRRMNEAIETAKKNNVGEDDAFAMMPSRYGENVHKPEFIHLPAAVQVNESVSLGYTVLAIRARDRDLGYNGKLVYGVSDGDDDSLFRIEPDTGDLNVVSYLDREARDEYTLNITVSDLGKPQRSTWKLLKVIILDVNDNAPKVDKRVSSFRVSENARNGTVIFKINAKDPDLGENGKVVYSLMTDTMQFSVDRTSGNLYISGRLDRERQELYELTVRASDSAPEPLTLHTEALIRIIVGDVNDNAPQFLVQNYTVKALEDLPVGSVVAIVTAVDPDLGSGGRITYSLETETSSSEADEKIFEIDPLSGTVRTVTKLDYEQRQVHTLIVKAVDGGLPYLSSETLLTVEIVDVNENVYTPEFSSFYATAFVDENEPPGTLVTTVTATDGDPPGDASRVGYSIVDGDGLGYFSIDSEGNIRTMVVLDAETKSSYWLTVMAFDHATVPLHSRIEVYVEVKNVNDNVPLTNAPVYYPRIMENAAPNTAVIQLEATDGDLSATRITYKITSGNPGVLFFIEPTTGLITTTGRKLDRETESEHILEVTVIDDGIPVLTSTTSVIISVDDVNDNAPELLKKAYRFKIPETQPVQEPLTQENGTAALGELSEVDQQLLDSKPWTLFGPNDIVGPILFRILAKDRDFGDNAKPTYTLKAAPGYDDIFAVEPETGFVHSDHSFRGNQDYSFYVRATDNGSPNMSSMAKVNVEVLKIPENSKYPPEIQNPNLKVDITEIDTVGYTVALIMAVDKDQDYLWYKIESGDPDSEFMIEDDGNVLLARQLNWESVKEYNLTISVTDGVYTTTTQLFVSVKDINEYRPKFSQHVYEVNVTENAETGSPVVRLSATDDDQDTKLLYGIHSAQHVNSIKSFAVDYLSGIVSVLQPLDRESIARHELTVVVKDQSTPSKKNFARVIITVVDVNDHAPEFSSKIIQCRVFETAAVGTSVLRLMATDKDHGENAAVSYQIMSGNVGNAFGLDSKLGTLRVMKELDMSVATEYVLMVKAIDSGSPPLYSTVHVYIVVVMADNASPKFDNAVESAELYENEPSGTVVKRLQARSTSSLLFELVRGDTYDVFAVNPSTGVLTTKRPLDYETRHVYNLSVTATNMAGSKATCHVSVHVLDRNDNPPVLLNASYKGMISEAAPIGSLVLLNDTLPLLIRATDADSGSNGLLQYEIVEFAQSRMFHVVSNTGAIRTTTLLDYETSPNITFRVRVIDQGNPRQTSEVLATVLISILDVNDCPPVFTSYEYNASVLVPTYANVAVVQLKATDGDSEKLTKLTYSIAGGNEANVYAIDPDRGLITVREPSSGIKSSPHSLMVSVTDGKYSSQSTVNIIWYRSEDSSLKFQKSVYYATATENDTKVRFLCAVTVVGAHLNEHLLFSISNPSKYFQIGPTTGIVSTAGIAFDREVREMYQIIVQAKSMDADNELRIAHVPVNVTILDINDNAPMFVNLPYYAVVSIDAKKDDLVTKVHAVDLDQGENAAVRYELTKGPGELFRVSRSTGEIFLRHNLESQNNGRSNEYKLTIAAFDGGLTSYSTEVEVNVKVMDRSMPVFDKQFYSVSVPENIDLYTPLPLTIRADSPLARKLIYSIVGGNTFEEFAIDFNTADGFGSTSLLYAVDNLDFEQVQHYTLTVRATDSVSGVSADVLVSIMVTDVNDCAPEFLQESYNVSVSESSSFGSFILKVTATDNDTDINRVVKYSIKKDSENSTDYFHIDDKDGSIYLKQSLDHETRPSHHLVLEATDSGVPPLRSTAHLWVTVVDVNDNAPKFEQSSYSCWLSKDVERGQFVTMVSATDPDIVDHSRLIYGITGGNMQQMFDINSTSGVVIVSNLNKLASENEHVLNISVSDGVYTSFSRVRIEMVSTNKHCPVFEKLQYDARIMENQIAGTEIIRVQAIDNDTGPYGEVNYSIQSKKLSKIFHIDNVTGVIQSRMTLDREETPMYEISVLACDQGARCGFTLVRVRVSDENDNSPRFQLPEYKTCIDSLLPINTGFLTVKAVDDDQETTGQITYSINDIEPSDITKLMTVNKYTGALVLLKSVENLKNNVYQFFLRATDSGTPPRQSDVPVELFIRSPEDLPPVFLQQDQKFNLTESAPIGTIVTTVKLVSEVDAKYRVTASENTAKLFTINNKGEITTTGLLDREKQALHILGIVAYTESSPPLTALTEVHVKVLDENDNIPEFDNDYYNIKISEIIAEGTPVVKTRATDLDEGKNSELKYVINSNMNVPFVIDQYSGSISVSVSNLDREIKSSYTFDVIAFDSGTPSLNSTVKIHIALVDYNDNPSRFSQTVYSASVEEDSLPGTVVVQLTLIDEDNELPSTLMYHIYDGDVHSNFAIRSTGEVYVTNMLDRETIDKYQLTILVTDGKYVSTTQLHITVIDVNDEKPICLRHSYRRMVSEGAPIGSVILTVDARDADLNPKLRYYLTGNGAEHFSLDIDTGLFKTAVQLDRERQSRYNLEAHVQDREKNDWECISKVEIIMVDINDNAPVFVSNNNTASLSEDAQIGTIVIKMHANDADIGLNRKLKYSLQDSADNRFIISPDSGIVTLAKKLDRETCEMYNISVKAVDHGTPPLSGLAQLTVIVLDVNDNPPIFVQRMYYATVSEIASIDTEVTRVLATSLDSGINAQVVYSIVGGNEHNKFSINPETGIISVFEILDYERVRDYLLTVQATDLGEPPLSNQATVNITVLDANDNAPIFGQLAYTTQVSEDIHIGEVAIKVSATDLDSEINGKIRYALVKGDHHQQFSIDPYTGNITITKPLDREFVSSYNLQIRATDSGTPELISFALVNIQVTDVNDNPPLFSQHNYSAFVHEDKKPGWIVCQLSVTDADMEPNGGPFIFDIRNNEDGSAFSIDPDGTVRTASRLDHRYQQNYELEIRVFDNGKPVLHSDTWLNIKVIEESQFPPIITPLEIWVGSWQDRWEGGTVGQIHATDQDEYDTLVYYVMSQKELFKVEERSGELRAPQGLDAGIYSINISVSDGKFTSFSTANVVVESLTDDMLSEAVSIRLKSVTPQHFLSTQKKMLMRSLKSNLAKEVSLISVQDAPQGNLDILLYIRGGIDLSTMHNALQKAGLIISNNVHPCNCTPGHGVCSQRIAWLPDQVQTIVTDMISFVAPAHTHQPYCSCRLGFIGKQCESKMTTECLCEEDEICIPDNEVDGKFKCDRPRGVGDRCLAGNETACLPPIFSNLHITWIQLIAASAAVIFIIMVICILIICRKCRVKRRNARRNKNITMLNTEFKRSSKISNLEVSQRPASYTAVATNPETAYMAAVASNQLNNLDTLRSYGSAGDELENVPLDYLRNLNRGSNNKIMNDLKTIPDVTRIPRRSVSCAEEDTRILGGYHWDCSDWVRRSQNPLPNISEVPGSEVPDSSDFHSDSNDEVHHPIIDPARDLETLDEELYLSYRSEDDDVVTYGFPQRYPSQSELSTNVCEIEDPDMPMSTAV